MDEKHKELIARAAKHIVRDDSLDVTEVIPPNEDRHLKFGDRLAAMLAALFLCGPSYFILWYWLFLEILAGSSGYRLPFWTYSWRGPALLTGLTILAAFLKPAWTVRVFGKLMRPFNFYR